MGTDVFSSIRRGLCARGLGLAAAIACMMFAGVIANAEVESAYVTSSLGDVGEVRRTSNLSPTSPELVVSTTNPIGIALDTAGGKVYWINGDDWIRRSNLDGTDVEDLVVGVPGPQDIALDLSHGKMYWTDYATHKIQRANLDGSGMEDVVTGLSAPLCVDVDIAADKIYWTDPATQQLQRANLDGTMVEDLLDSNSGVEYPIGIAVDASAGKVYFCDQGFERIMRCNLDGTELEVVLLTERPAFLELDLPAGKMYWSETFGTGVIKRANLDGSAPEVVLAPTSDAAADIAYDAASRIMYWSEHDANSIRRQQLPAVEVLATGLAGAGAVDVHTAGGMVYWTDWDGSTPGTGIIQRAEMGGGDVETLAADLVAPAAIAIFGRGSKVYWADSSEQKIYRMNLNGTCRAVVVGSAAGEPVGLAIDASDGKVYWSDAGGTIRRASVSGLNPEILVSGLDAPMGIAIDPDGGKIYWAETGAVYSIQRANTDGTNVEPLLTGLSMKPLDISLDVPAGKVYWTNGRELRRANFDGSSPEIVADLLLWPVGVALDLVEESDPPIRGGITSNISGVIREGVHLVLTAPAGAGFQWLRDGEDIPGETGPTFEFEPVGIDDAGAYSVIYNDGSKTEVQSEPFFLEVSPVDTLPVSGLAIAIISVVILGIGVWRIAGAAAF